MSALDKIAHCSKCDRDYSTLKPHTCATKHPTSDGGTYSLSVDCPNCGYDDRLTVSKGTLLKDTPCPVCGCLTLNRK